jgi:3-hydroxyacyl-CoA dehydrogenase/enoyl-CoA hydratase/3-hydroxybutyryl-CoA epimerase
METLIDHSAETGLRAALEDGIVRIEIDAPGSKVNKLTTALMTELEALLVALAARREVRGVVLASGKPDTFVAGADIAEIESLTDPEDARRKSEFGQRVFARLQGLGKPVVAAVHGACLGGGCEMVLACSYRILSDDPATKIGLPEVRLGILPGFGGTQRLPRVVGLQSSLDLILSGKTLDARRALRAGLADEVVYPALLAEAAARAAGRLAEAGRFGYERPSRRPRYTAPGFLDRTALGQALVLRLAAHKVRGETQGHYPAPLAALEAVRAGLRSGGTAYAREAELLGKLAVTPESKNLIQIFRLGEENKKLGADLPKPLAVRQVAIVGAGVMGGGIAHLVASHDVRVRMKDLGPEQLLTAFRTARDLFLGAVRRGRMERRVVDAKMAHISASLDYSGFSLAEVVIEAVVENLEVKRKVLGEVESQVRDTCVLCTNTSALSIAAMGQVLHRPGRLCGMHFFNPVHRMPLVEIVRTPETDPEALATAIALVRRLGKTPVLVQDAPGFLVNRVLAPYMNESGLLFEEGQDVEALDALMRKFGMPMGPFELLDEIGTDVAAKVGQVLHAGLGERARPAALAACLHAKGRLGRKSGRGVYVYEGAGGRKRKPDRTAWSSLRAEIARNAAAAGSMSDATSRATIGNAGERQLSDEVILDRVFGLMINEAARCLEEGIVTTAGELDLALVYGIGFPPFRGGLLKYADRRGLADLVDRLRAFEGQYGSRFAPAERLVRMAASKDRFFPDPRA